MTNTTKHKRPMRNIPVNISYQIRVPSKTPMTDLEVLIYSPLYNTTIYLDREDKVRDRFDEYIRSKNKLENPEHFVIVGMGTNANDTIPLKNHHRNAQRTIAIPQNEGGCVMDKPYIVSIDTFYEPDPIPTRVELYDIGDDFSYESGENFYNCENRIGFGSQPYSVGCVRKEWRTYGRPYVL